MTLRTKSYLSNVSLINIENTAEDVGYYYYLPINFYFDLINMVISSRLGSFSDCINKKDVVTEFYKNIPNELFYLYDKEPVMRSAMLILKSLANSISFRALEQNKIVEVSNISNNYILELDEVEIDFINSTEKEEDFSKIIKLSLNLFSKQSTTSIKIVKSNINDISSVVKVKKSEFIRPMFIYNLIKRSFKISKEKEMNDDKQLVLIEDKSTSMACKDIYNIVKALQLTLLKTELVVHYYYFAGKELIYHKLQNKEEKSNLFKSTNYFMNNCDYSVLFKELNEKHKNQNVLLITDGQDSIKQQSLNFTLNCINIRSKNFTLKNLCKSNNGKYLFIN
jgi:hypothetical protein